MPRLKPVEKYDPAFFEMVERAARCRETINLIIADRGAAIRLRNQLYSFRYALREEGHPLADAADTLTFELTPKGLSIHRPTTPGIEHLREALHPKPSEE